MKPERKHGKLTPLPGIHSKTCPPHCLNLAGTTYIYVSHIYSYNIYYYVIT